MTDFIIRSEKYINHKSPMGSGAVPGGAHQRAPRWERRAWWCKQT